MSFTGRSTRSSRYFLALLLLFLVHCGGTVSASPKVNTTKKSKTTGTKTTSTKSTKTTLTSLTTKSSKSTTPSVATKSSTSTAAKYTWKTVPGRSGCPTYEPTAGLATQTVSSNGVIATAFANIYGGEVSQQLAAKDENGDSSIIKMLDDGKLQVLIPGSHVIFVSDDGILVYDEKCQGGVRLSVPNFFNLTSSPSPSQPRSISSTSDMVSFERPTLLSRAYNSTKFKIQWEFKGDCGGYKPENVLVTHTEFNCTCLNGLVGGEVSLSSYGRGVYEAQITAPFIREYTCEEGVDELRNKAKYFSKWDAFKEGVERIDNDSTFGPGAGEFFLRLGIVTAVNIYRPTRIAASAVNGFFTLGGADLMKSTICAMNGFKYSLTATTEHYGVVEIDSQSYPFTSKSGKTITLETPESERCFAACAQLQTDPSNCGACGRACKPGQQCRGGSCAQGSFCEYPYNCHTDFTGAPMIHDYCYCADIDGSYVDGFVADLYSNNCPTMPRCSNSNECESGSYCSVNTCCADPPGVCIKALNEADPQCFYNPRSLKTLRGS